MKKTIFIRPKILVPCQKKPLNLKPPRLWYSNIDLSYHLIIDRKRTLAFKKAITKAVRKNDIILELGSGTAILSMFAAQAGARKIYAVEIDSYLCKVAEDLIFQNRLSDKIVVLNRDILKLNIPEKVDLIIGELVSGGLIEEIEVPAFNKALDYLKPGGRIIPSEILCSAALVNYDFNLYNLSFKMPIYRWRQNRLINKQKIPEFLSKPRLYLRVNLRKKNNLKVTKTLPFLVEKSGIANGINVQTNTRLFGNIWCKDTTSYAGDIILPIKSRKVQKGGKVQILISHLMGGGFETAKVNWLSI